MITQASRSQVQEQGRRWAAGAARLMAVLASLTALALAGAILVAAALPLFGYRTTVISGGSMAPAIPRGSLVISRPVDTQTLEMGDIITFRRSETTASVTHRIVAVREVQGERAFTVKGDANESPDPNEVTFTTEVAKVLIDIPYAGFLVGLSRTPEGMLLLLIPPAIGLAALQLLAMGKGRQPKETVRV